MGGYGAGIMRTNGTRRFRAGAGLSRLVLAGAAVAAAPAGAWAQGIHDPSASYRSASDSPFIGLALGGGAFFLENFEDGLLNTPGVVAVGGVVLVRDDQFGDSVDGDDGVIDNSGNSGGLRTGAYYSNGLATLRFEFDAAALGGRLPTHAGLVATDCSTSSAMTLTAYRAGVVLGSVSGFQVSERINLCAEDRFYGYIDLGGIDAIEMTAATDRDWAMDHLQYGRACGVDFNLDGFVDFFDYDDFVTAFEAGNPRADFNADGFLDFFDYSDFVACFEGSGCPDPLAADFNGDGFVDFFDYGDFVEAFEVGC